LLLLLLVHFKLKTSQHSVMTEGGR